MTYSSFACAQHSENPGWLSPGGNKIYSLEIPAHARRNTDSVAVVTWMLQPDPDPGDLHWKLEIFSPAQPNIKKILVFDTTLNEDNPIKCAMQQVISAKDLVPGTNEVHVTYMPDEGSEGKLLVSDIVVHFHVDK